jgi:drug/metabolite transporter (DMT)-like permease
MTAASPTAPQGPSLRYGLVVLALLTLVWGVNWPAMKLGVAGFPPWHFRAGGVAFGIVALFTLARLSGAALRPPPGLWGKLLVASILNVTGWQVFSVASLQYIGSGRAAIVAYTMPLMTALLSVPLLGDRLTARIAAALILGMAGMACLLPPELFAARGAQLLGIGLMLCAALSWALGTIHLKQARLPMPTTVTAAWLFVFALPPMLIGAAFEPMPDLAAMTWPTILGALYATTIPVCYGYWAWYRLVETMPATIASIATLATPVVGVLSGAAILGEAVGWREIAALGFVIASLVLVLYRKQQQV